MALGIAATLFLESWDARHEANAVLNDLIEEQQLIAEALVAQASSRGVTPSAEPAANETTRERVCRAARAIERNGIVAVVVDVPGAGRRDCNGRDVVSAALDRALATGESAAVVPREEAPRLGLAPRTAVAGIVRLAPGDALSSVAVVSSAGNERDRSSHQQIRTIVSVSAASLLILGFGLVILRRQRRELALEKQVELERARKERDAELAKAQRMATLAALASGFAHEIGTPLGIISGRIEQLRAMNLEQNAPRGQELLLQVSQQIERIGRLIRSFLAFARGDSPMLVPARAEDLARNAARLVGHRFSAAEVGLELELGAAKDARITCEPALFEQVIVNLLSNALEASSPGQHVTLSIEPSASELAFVVRDEGAGMPEAERARATEPFFTTKAGRGGSGIGLTIAREIVVHHRGDLVIRGRSDGAPNGTEAVVRVPPIGVALG
jgi:signal transduction histidine kinase